MNKSDYQKAQNLRRQLHVNESTSNKNESSINEATKIKEKLAEIGCGTKQING